MNQNKSKEFRQYIKNIESKEYEILKLQKKYRNGEISEKDLTKTQIKALCNLYDKQIEELKKYNELRKKRILKNKKISII